MVCLLLAAPVFATNDVVMGVVGMNPVESSSCVAAYVPLEDGKALTGVEWYNNDGTSGFPEVVVSGGANTDPGTYDNGVKVGYDIYGQSSAWSQCQWDGAYRSDAGGVYVIFRLPVASVYVNEGAGGGAAVGVQSGDDGLSGWLSVDGVEWIGLHSSYGLAFRPIVADVDHETVVLAQATKALGGRQPDELESDDEITTLRTAMGKPYPNPFNPMTKLKFTLAEATMVELEIFDVRGQLVKRLANQVYSAGEHMVTWLGRNERDREVGSGVYLARLKAGSFVQTHRLMLVR